MAKAQFHQAPEGLGRGGRRLGHASSASSPIWAKGFDEPVRITYDVGLGREFRGEDLRADSHVRRRPSRGRRAASGASCARATSGRRRRTAATIRCPAPSRWSSPTPPTGAAGGCRGPSTTATPTSIEHQARLVVSAPKLMRLARELAALRRPRRRRTARSELSCGMAQLRQAACSASSATSRPPRRPGRRRRRIATGSALRACGARWRTPGSDGYTRPPCAPTSPSPLPSACRTITPPAFRVETVEPRLRPAAPAPRACAPACRWCARAKAPEAPLVLDGVRLKLLSASVDGRAAVARRLPAGRRDAVRARRAGRLHAGDRGRDRSAGQHRAGGALHLRRPLLHPVRGGGASARSPSSPTAPTCWPATPCGWRRTRCAYPRLLSNGNLMERDAGWTGAATSPCGTIPSPSPATCSRWWPASWTMLEDRFTTAERARGGPAHLRRSRPVGAGRLRHGRAEALHALRRDRLRARVRPRPVHDRGRARLQLRRHGEQGAEHLQQQPAAGRSGDRHRRRLRAHRKRGRPRILPQLDG